MRVEGSPPSLILTAKNEAKAMAASSAEEKYFQKKSLFRRAEPRRFNNQNDSEINAKIKENEGQGTTRTCFF
jgi:hypothetical protein